MFANDWDPMTRKNDAQEVPSPQCLRRLKSDFISLRDDPPCGICVVADEEDMFNVHAVIIGPADTPYEKGFFYFFLRIPPDYPMSPPRVRFMTTDGGYVRFNPNLYENGKVCLSILGTWSGPSWSPGHTLGSVLISIQSLLNEKPYHNEPGYEMERRPGDAQMYNERVMHETLRVAVCGMLQSETGLPIPPMIVFTMQQKFIEFYDYYINLCQAKLDLDGKLMESPLNPGVSGTFQYGSIMKRLREIWHDLKPCKKDP